MYIYIYIQTTNVICMLNGCLHTFEEWCKRGFVVGRLWATEGAHAQRAAQLPMYSLNASNGFPSDHPCQNSARVLRHGASGARADEQGTPCATIH